MSQPAPAARDPRPGRLGPATPWRRFVPVVFVLSSEAADAVLLAALFPTIMVALGLASADLGRLVALSKAAVLLGGPAWIWCTGRLARRTTLLASAQLCAVLSLAMGLAEGPFSLAVPFCLVAAVSGGTVPIMTSAIAGLFSDRERGRAVGIMYGALNVFSAAIGSAVGQLSDIEDGWRAGFMAVCALNLVAALAIHSVFPVQRGHAQAASPDPVQPGLLRAWRSLRRMPSYGIMLLSRLLSGHLAISAFGIVFLTGTRHFTNAAATLVLLPFGVGYCAGCIGGAAVADWLHGRLPERGRVAVLLTIQLGFALSAYLATQIEWSAIESYMALWFAMGLMQGCNPGVNRPIVMAVTPPFLWNWAFLIMLCIVEPFSWMVYSFGISVYSDPINLKDALLVVLVGIMVVNAAVIVPLFWTYGPDQRRIAILGAGAPASLLVKPTAVARPT